MTTVITQAPSWPAILFQIEHNKKSKEEGKRIRQDKDQVLDKLFNIFEKHQYYNISDLVRLTNQPIVSTAGWQNLLALWLMSWNFDTLFQTFMA